VLIEGGIGVGRVTKPGLACAQGGPAINPTPRRMITEELTKVMHEKGYEGGLQVTISIPAGVEIAKKTFNPRLGIIGGLSVLGTSGIVEPMSEKALIETMYVEMRAQQARGNKHLLVFFGNYGEDFTRDELKLELEDAVTCSNFVGELLDYAVFLGFESLLLIGHSGKLVKLAQGVMNTHSKYADCRTELFALEAMFYGASVEVGKEIFNCLTTDEVTKILRREELFETVMREVTQKIDFYMQHRVHGKIKTAALMFSNVYGILGRTEFADELIQLHIKKESKYER
jgi:cobalt-precorrin-5B (C1)-methyltransferase